MSARATLSAVVAGALFGTGLCVSGMSSPLKVLGFLDITGNWDPSLLFVMAGAIGVHFWAYRWVARRSSPYLAPRFALPTRRDIDEKLVVGAAIFGLGWGLAGFCPGPSLVALPSGIPSVFLFVVMMVLGMQIAARLEGREASAPPPSGAPTTE